MNKFEEEFKAKLRKEALSIPKEKRQQILDMFRSGKTIGEIKEEMHLDTMVTSEIIFMNIQDIKILNAKTI